MALNYEKMMRRIEAAKGNKLLWDTRLKECYQYFLPERETFDDHAPGAQKNERVFESTAIEALSDYASRMESQLVPPGREWMTLEAGSEIPEDQEEEVDKSLEEMTKILFSHINDSNFSSQIHETFLDVGISTGAIIIEDGDGIQSALRFRAVPMADIIIEKSQKGIIDTVWREITLNAADIPSIFPYAKLTDDIIKAIKDKPEQEFEFIEGVALNDDQLTFTSMVLYPSKKDVLYEARELSSPWVVFREASISGEVYGRGRALRCLSDVKTLNKVYENYLRAAALIAQPIYTATDDGVINPHTIRLKPNSIIPVGSNDTANPTLRPLAPAGEYQISQDIIQTLQDRIRRTMLSKPFGQIDETPVRTATEMSIRNADLAETSLSASGRIQSELLQRLIARCVFLLKEQGKIADFQVNGKEVAIKFTSPASRKQDESDIATLLRFSEMMQMLPPEYVMQAIKIEDFPKAMADTMGVSKDLIRTEMEIAAKKEEQKQLQQQMMEQEQQAAAK